MRLRTVFTMLGLALAGMLLFGQFRRLWADPTVWPPDDFVEYWAAARLTLEGKNPYDGRLLLPLQRDAGRDTDEAIMMWNPPWTLAVILPLGMLEARLAQLLWLALNLAVVVYCGDRLWMMLGGSREKRGIGWAAALGFLPSLFALQSGQIPPLVLLGLVLFLECRQRGWPVLAGAATLLLAIKPHLAYLVWPAIACEALATRQLRTVLGGVLAVFVGIMLPLAFNPHVVTQYADALANRPPSQWMTLTLGTLLRLLFGQELFRLQFLPMLLGLGWFAWQWHKHGVAWLGITRMPVLVLVSFITTPYGAWPFDMVLLLPAILVLLVKWQKQCLPHRTAILAGLVVVNAACLVLNLAQSGSFAFIWVPPAVLILFLLGRRSPELQGAPLSVIAA